MDRTRRRTVLLLLAALLLVSGPALAAAPSPAPNPVRSPQSQQDKAKRATFGVQPASAKALDGRPYLLYDVTPGAGLDDHVGIVNYSLRALRLAVYATDALNDDKGGFALRKRTEAVKDAGAWITLGARGKTGSVTVPPQSQVILPIQLRVPKDASPGDHVAGVIASLTTVSRNRDGVNVALDQRVATRVYIRVSGTVRAELTVERVRATYHGSWNPIGRGGTTITFRVRNTGNVKVGGKARVDVRGPFGVRQAGAALPEIPLLLPGSAVDLRTSVPHVLPLVWEHADVTVQPTVLVGDVDPHLRVISGDARFWAVPWALLAVLLAAVLLVRTARQRARRTSGAPRHLRPQSAGMAQQKEVRA